MTWRVDDGWGIPAVLKPIDAIPKPAGKNKSNHLGLKEAKRLLDGDALSAEARARTTLEANPYDPTALCVLGGLQRREGRYDEARAVLEPLTRSQPQMDFAWFELGMVLRGLGASAPAIEALIRAVDLDPANRNAWYVLGDLLPFPEIAAETESEIGRRLAKVETALAENDIEGVETLLNPVLEANPANVRATKLLAEVMLRTGRWAEFERLIQRCLDIAPDFVAARFRYVTMRFARMDLRGLLPHVDELVKRDPENLLYRSLKALVLFHGQQIRPAIGEFEPIVGGCTERPGLRLAYATALQAARNNGAAAAYRAAIDMVPSFADAYLSLAHLTSFRFDESLMTRLEAQLSRPDLPQEDRAKLHYVLGKALENSNRYAESFEHYRTSNNILRNTGADAANRSAYVQRAKELFTPAFIRARAGWGYKEPGPVFIVGMPRSGSTLVEQILSRHSSIEGLGELTIVTEIAKAFVPDRADHARGGYPDGLRNLGPDSFRRMGEEYLSATRALRRRDVPFFVDKLPSNYLHTGLIHLSQPNARIIDVRRHPLDCCFSCFKHYFAAGVAETTDLRAIGRAYVEYAELMAHFDAVLPGRVHRIIYENLVANLEGEVRRLLDHLGLPFEPQCLNFHQSDRYVRTLSADQVAQPLFSTAVAHARKYERWLEPLKHELGSVLDSYPGVPRFYGGVQIQSRNPLKLGSFGQRFGFVSGLMQVPFVVKDAVAGRS